MFSEKQKEAKGAAQLFDFIRNSYSSNLPLFSLAIELPGTGFIGSCGVSKIGDTIWECYYSLNREYWGKGFASEAMEALVDYCFHQSGIEEIRAYMSVENPRSSKVAEKIGMTFLGTHVHPAFKSKGKLYAISRAQHQKLTA